MSAEFGGLRVAEALPVGAMCIIRSQTSQRWCRAIILKNLPDQTLVRERMETIHMEFNHGWMVILNDSVNHSVFVFVVLINMRALIGKNKSISTTIKTTCFFAMCK